MENRDFKGIWIPKEIWLNTELTILDKIILMEIDSLDNENHCIAGNEYIANFCGCSERKISASISKLVEMGYIEIVSFDGRLRVLRSRLEKFSTLPGKKCEADSQNFPPINIDNNIIINKINNNISSTKSKGYDDDVNFVGFWEMYPRKVGKSEAFKAWNKSIKCASIDDIANGLDKWVNYWKTKRTDVQYIPHPATWLNGKNWEAFPEIKSLENYVVEIDGDNF